MSNRNWCVGVISLVILAGIGWELRPKSVHAAEGGPLENPPVGAECMVYLRRDYIATFVKEETSGIEMVDTKAGANFWRKYVNGTLGHVNEQWVVVRTPQAHDVWIPRNAVVAIDVGK